MKFKGSLIGIVEASLHNGPAFFNCFPNFSISLSDLGAHQACSLGIYAKGFEMKPQSEDVALIYRVYFKVMNSILPDIAYNNQLKGITTLFLTDFKNNVTIPKMITWEQVNLSGKWDF